MKHHLDRLIFLAVSPNVRGSVVYLGGNVLAAIFPLLLLPVLTRHLTAAEYGIYALALVLSQFFFPLANLGLANAVSRDFVDRQRLDFPRVVTISLILSTAALMVLILLVEVLERAGLGQWFGLDQATPHYFLYAVYMMVASQTVLSYVLALLQMNERPLAYGLLRIGSQVLFAALAVVGVVVWKQGAAGVIFGKAAADAIALLIGLWLLRRGRYLVSRWNSKEAKRVLAYSLPLVPHMFAVSLIAVVDRLLLTEIAGVSATGIYMAGFQVGMVMWLIVNSTNQAWVPWFYKTMAHETPESRALVRKAILLVGAAYVAIAAVLALLAPLAVRILSGAEFHGAAPVAALIVVAFMFQGFYALFNSFLYYEKRTGLLSVASVLTIVINAVACYFLIHLYDVVGAAWGTVVGYCASFLFVAAFSSQYLRRSPEQHANGRNQ